MGFGPLRVINEDRVAPGEGFGKHPHRDMEIISYVLDGELEHKDSMGTGSVIRPGRRAAHERRYRRVPQRVQPPRRRTVCTSCRSGSNPTSSASSPAYEQKFFGPGEKRGKLRLLASSDGRDGSVRIHQDAQLYAALVDGDENVTHRLAHDRRAYVHVARGAVTVNGQPLGSGDALKIEGESEVVIEKGDKAEVLLFDLN